MTHDMSPRKVEKAALPLPEWRVTIYKAWCKGCGICVAFCPKDVYEQDLLDRPQIINPHQCTGCQKCVLHCPDFAISVDKTPPPSQENPHA